MMRVVSIFVFVAACTILPVFAQDDSSSSGLTINSGTIGATTNTTSSDLNTDGTGTLTLSGANTYTGGTVVTGGTLIVGSTTNTDSNGTLGAGGTVEVSGATDGTSGAVYIVNAGTLTTDNNINYQLLSGTIS